MSKDGPIFHKFNVTRTDGSSEPGGKHRDCDYFVLDTTHDRYAKYALAAYADACEETHPNLAADIRQTYTGFTSYNPPTGAVAQVEQFGETEDARAIQPIDAMPPVGTLLYERPHHNRGILLAMSDADKAAVVAETIEEATTASGLVDEVQRVIRELRAYNPPADPYNGKHIHGVWARQLEAAIGREVVG